MSDLPTVVVGRLLLPAGMEMLTGRCEVRSGGADPTREEILALVRGAAVIVADPTIAVDEELLAAAGPGLRAVANFAVGYDNIDLEACRGRAVVVTNTPDVLTNATAELALALTLAAARFVSGAERDLRAGHWRGWDPAAYRGLELSGATFGIVGLGRIGGRYGTLLAGFGVDLVYASPRPRPQRAERLGARWVELEDLLRSSDVVSLHAPGTPGNRHMIDARALDLMKESAVLVNTSRGVLVDSEALADALREGRIGAAGLDVFEGEPELPPALAAAPKAVITPHIGSATVKARDAMARTVAENAIAVLEGRDPPNRIA
ncbi:MAG TPA: D-glycerate dehydrogenase [Solirubrobacterales bacterium]|nr:D-glycerate dehydrogenase [Solirubrobacterales bacterium]